MYKPSPELSLELATAVRDEQNAIEESLREEFLIDRLFHRDFADAVSFEEKLQLHDDFIAAKRSMNMGERFALALSPEFFNKIHVVELGLTTRPGENGELDGLKSQFNDLLHFLKVEGGLNVEELPRESSGRNIHVTRLSEAAPDTVVIERNRPLIYTYIPQPEARIAVVKRMVFAMPKELHSTLMRMGEAMAQERLSRYPDQPSREQVEAVLKGCQMECIENAMDINPKILGIRTAYYLMTEGLPQEEEAV